MGAGPWQLLAQGIQDTTSHFVGRRDRDHSEHRENKFRLEDRTNFLADRAHAEIFDSSYFQRRAKDLKAAGLHPLAGLGAQVSGPIMAQQSSSYGGGSGVNYPRYSPVDLSSMEVNRAHALKLKAETNFIEQQTQDSIIARARSISPDKLVEDIHNPQRTTHVKYGVPVRSAPAFSDAQTYEDRYGELGGSVLGLGNIPADVLYSAFQVLKKLGTNFNAPQFDTVQYGK